MRDGKRLAILSLFRDRSYLVPAYIQRLEGVWSHDRHVVCVEGDSVDNTRDLLRDWSSRDSRTTVLRHDVGLPEYGSVVHPKRFKALAEVSNAGLDWIVSNLLVDYVAFVESDIEFDSSMLCDLESALVELPAPAVVAPMVWVRTHPSKEPVFYDVWGFRSRGDEVKFEWESAAWYRRKYGTAPFEIETAGTVLFCDAAPVYAGARFTAEEAIVGFVRQLRSRGASAWAVPSVNVVHPSPWVVSRARRSLQEKA